jgi:coenzyme F420 hydrogenase subunit beta
MDEERKIAGRPNSIQDVAQQGLCIGCGICAYSDAIGSMRYSKEHAQSVPLISNGNGCDPLAFAICPGKGYNVIADSGALYSPAPYNLELGHIYTHYAAHSNDPEVLRNASSGGLMSNLAIVLLESHVVDRVLVTHFEYSPEPRAIGVIASSRNDILKSQGSKYCPVDFSSALREIKNNNYKVAVLGTPCQIAGIREIQRRDRTFSDKIFITISTFCGGVKSYDNLDSLAQRHGIAPNAVTFFRFRGSGQPGSMLIKDNIGSEVVVPYPEYVGHTGFSKHLRCHLCVDATGELADIACGDAWLPRFRNRKYPWSIIIARNKKAADLIQKMAYDRQITTEAVSLEEITSSQRENLTSKKVRQKSRRYLYRLLRIATPTFDGGYHDVPLCLGLEVKVFLKHRVKILLERLHLFYPIYTLACWATQLTSRGAARTGSPFSSRKGSAHAE